MSKYAVGADHRERGIAGVLWAAISPTAAFAHIAAWMAIALIPLALLEPQRQTASL